MPYLLTKHTHLFGLLLSTLLLLAACAPGETEVASDQLPPTVAVDEVTVQPLQPVDQPSATPPNTPTKVSVPTQTAITAVTIDPTVTATKKPTAVAERVSAEYTPTIATIEAIQLTVAPSPTAMPTTESRSPIYVPLNLKPLLDQIVEDAATHSGAARDAIIPTTIEAVTWRSGAIGCPEPGVAYTQALVDGYRILLDANGSQLLYHTSGTTSFVYCNTAKYTPEDPAPVGSGDT